MSKIQKVKGTLDILPSRFVSAEDVHLHIERWHLVERTAREAFRRYGFEEIRTPIIEKTELFERGVGTETDVNKEMYTFEDKGGDRITLRPESTASVVRACIENGLYNHSGLTKLYYIGPQFRREHAQKGRYRQFSQIGVEVLGQSDSPAIEAEVIELLAWYFKELGIANIELMINSVGDENCRPAFIEKLKEAIRERLPKLCGDCQRRFESNPLRVLDCKVPSCQPYLNELPKITEMLCEPCDTHFKTFRAYLDERRIAYIVNPRLVRGLDYYTRTAFEITGGNLGAQNTIVGGGRYDGLSEMIGGPPLKGFGFAFGLERMVMSLLESASDRAKESPELFIAYIGEEAQRHSFALARRLREAGVNLIVDLEGRKLKKALAVANSLGARYSLIIGDDEIKNLSYTLRNMTDGEQRRFDEIELIEYLKGR
jgi:histidyl-tRNA synthetase